MIDPKTYSIYEFSSPAGYLRQELQTAMDRNPAFSLRAWAKKMGFANHSLLSLLLNGKRPILVKHLPKILKGLSLKGEERRYFEAMVRLENADSPAERDLYETRLRELHPRRQVSFVEVEKYRMIADWYHMAILEMTRLEDFQSDPEWISRRLGTKVSVQQIHEAIDRLIALGLLREEGSQLQKTQERLTTPKDYASQAIRTHHKQVMAQAASALESQALTERDFNSCAMTIRRESLPRAKEIIAEFRKKMSEHLESHPGDEVYQLSVQFFRLTEGEKKS